LWARWQAGAGALVGHPRPGDPLEYIIYSPLTVGTGTSAILRTIGSVLDTNALGYDYL
jgi:hypothetical protein